MQSNEGNTTKTKTRKCIVTGATALKKDLIRFVLSPQLQLIADIDQNLPGRGFWVKADRKTISEAINKNILSNATKKYVSIDKNLIDLIESQLKIRIIRQISLSRKAGQALFGFEKIKNVTTTKSIELLIQAVDGSEREKKRIINNSIKNIINNCLTANELGKIFGREKVIHCAILGVGFSEKIIFNANRLNNLKIPVRPYDNTNLRSLL